MVNYFNSKFLNDLYHVNQVSACDLIRESEGRGSQNLSQYIISSRTPSQKEWGQTPTYHVVALYKALEARINKTYRKDFSLLMLFLLQLAYNQANRSHKYTVVEMTNVELKCTL